MKRTSCIMLTIIFAISLAACSNLASYEYVQEPSYEIPSPISETPIPTLVPVTESTPTPATPPTTAPTPTPQAGTWQEAYAVLLKWYMTYAPPIEEGLIRRSFILHDIDLDGVPELIITYIQAGIWVDSVYTFRGGNLIPIEGNFFAYFGVYTPLNNQPGIIIEAYGDVCLMVLDGYNLVCNICLSRPFFPPDWYGAIVNWYINGEVVTEEEHESMLYSLISYDWEEERQNYWLWPYDLTEENIYNMISGWKPITNT